QSRRADRHCCGTVERRAVVRIDIPRQGELSSGTDLDHEQHDSACALFDRGAELGKMLGAAGGYAVGKFSQAPTPHEVHILNLNVAGRRSSPFKQEIDARVLPVSNLTPYRCVLRKVPDWFSVH